MKKYDLLLKQVKYLISFTLLLTSGFAFSQPTSQTFTTSGTYVIPTGYSATIKIEAWGGGGGGAIGNAGGGGGGGAYASSTITLTAGSYTIIVGAGGTGGTTATAGGASSFNSTIVIAAGGGAASGTAGGAGGSASSSTGSVTYSGGTGGTVSSSASAGGGGGGSATSSAAGGNGGVGNGGIGQGNGGNGGNNTSKSGQNGTAPGGGGGGTFNTGGTVTAGNGATGRVIVTVISYLPVVFGTIQAIQQGNMLNIIWITKMENNNDHFDIEASKDGLSFTKIATLASKAPNGSSDNQIEYSFSTPYDQISGLLGVSLIAILSVSFFPKRRKTIWAFLLIAFSTISYISCKKSDTTVSINGNAKMYVRIVQVDKDNKAAYSKVMPVIKE